MRFRNNFQKGNNPRRWCNICRYETLPIPVSVTVAQAVEKIMVKKCIKRFRIFEV